MEKLALDGFWLLGGLAAAFVVGVFVSTYIKDKIKGVPSSLRSALGTAETDAVAALKAAETKVVSDVAGMFKKSTATAKTAAATAVTPAAPAPAAGASGA
jgi:hypothetical protein